MIRNFKTMAIISVMALGLGGIARAAQDRDDNGQWRRDHDDDDNRGREGYRGAQDRAFRDGVTQGRYDRANGRRYDDRTSEWTRGDSAYRDAYRSGYEQGFRGDGGDRDDRRYPYGNRGAYGDQPYRIGVQDGRTDGQHDRDTGHSYRPTHDPNYKHADRGYSSVYGDKNSYKQQYRSGYLRGYEQGYGYNGRYGY